MQFSHCPKNVPKTILKLLTLTALQCPRAGKFKIQSLGQNTAHFWGNGNNINIFLRISDLQYPPLLSQMWISKATENRPTLHFNGTIVKNRVRTRLSGVGESLLVESTPAVTTPVCIYSMAIWVVEFSSRGIQNQKDFCIKINLPKKNY